MQTLLLAPFLGLLVYALGRYAVLSHEKGVDVIPTPPTAGVMPRPSYVSVSKV